MTALIIVQPNFFGALEHVDELTNWPNKKIWSPLAWLIPYLWAYSTPRSLGRKWCRYCSRGRSAFWSAYGFWRSYFGFFSTKLEFVRQMPDVW